ncbi:MAG: Tetratricopeptide 2 repeat protein [Pedosphaera sp.]|nr:Tetratricopeptide 2 repeat protein [Pedosphaera sp.]
MLAMSGLLMAGCANTPTTGKPLADASRASVAAAVTVDEVTPPEVDDKLVEAHAHYAQGTIYDLDDEPELALQEYSQAALGDPSNEQLVEELSRRYLQRKEPEKALDLLERATALPKASGVLFARLGLVYSRLGKDEQAVAATQTAIKRLPLSLSGYQTLFVIHLQKGRFKEAQAVLDDAAKRPDVPAEFLVNLAELYANLERQAPSQKEATKAGTKAALLRAMQLKPVEPRLRLKLADGFNMLGDTKNATELYLQLLRGYGDLPELRNDVRGKLADVYLREHDAGKAIEQLESIVREDPANPQAYYVLGGLAVDARKFPEAEDYFQKTLLLSDNFEQAYYDLADVQINLDHAKGALSTLEQARVKYSDTFINEFLTGLAYGKEKEYDKAVTHLTSAELLAKTSDPSRLNKYFYFQVGSVHERKGDYEQAEQYFEKTLELAPDFTEALNYFGYMLADRGVKLERAHEMIEKAVKSEPKNAAYLDSLGWVLYKLNQPGEALTQELKAVEFSEEPDATVYDHLGDIYAALKQVEKAREAWHKSLSVEPNEGIKKKLEPAANK